MIIKIDNIELPLLPKSFSVTIADLDGDNTGRTADGTLNRDRIAVKRKIELEWNAIEWSIASNILTMLSPVNVKVYYPDPQLGTYNELTMYVSDRPVTVAKIEDEKILWQGLKFSLVEV